MTPQYCAAADLDGGGGGSIRYRGGGGGGGNGNGAGGTGSNPGDDSGPSLAWYSVPSSEQFPHGCYARESLRGG